ncbi:hypothetical protein [Clostridium senegalense]|uniref:hypothetical protein n=1 Tax=Clostridium senegalense TaxID=1465809 RepID=UPI000288FBE1|nr:hypothetical protein [Clostridium senegalense]
MKFKGVKLKLRRKVLKKLLSKFISITRRTGVTKYIFHKLNFIETIRLSIKFKVIKAGPKKYV